MLQRGLMDPNEGADQQCGYYYRQKVNKTAHPLLLIQYFSIGMALSSFSILPIFGLP